MFGKNFSWFNVKCTTLITAYLQQNNYQIQIFPVAHPGTKPFKQYVDQSYLQQ